MGLVDVLMVAPLGAVPLAGVSLGHTWSFGCLVLLLGVSVGFDPLFSQAFGANRPGLAWRRLAAGGGYWASYVYPLPCFTGLGPRCWHLWGRIPKPLKLEACTHRSRYSESFLCDVWCRPTDFARGWPDDACHVGHYRWKYLCLSSTSCSFTAISVLQNWERLARLATVLCRWLMLLVLVMVSWRSLRRAQRVGRAEPAVSMAVLIPISAPVGLQIAAEFWGFSLSTFFVGWFGATAVAGHMLALNLASAAFMIPLGISTAAATRVGNLMGATLPWQPPVGFQLA